MIDGFISVDGLKKMLKERDLLSTGKKPALMSRLLESDAKFRAMLKSEATGGDESEEEKEEAPKEEDLRILTDEDFEKIRRLKLMKEMDKHANGGKKRKHDEVLGEDGLPQSFVTTDFAAKVDPGDLLGHQSKKKATKEQKIDSILQGREGREAFGAKKTPKGGGTTNAVKKRSKPTAMVIQSERVRSKAHRSARDSTALKNKIRANSRRQKTKRRSG